MNKKYFTRILFATLLSVEAFSACFLTYSFILGAYDSNGVRTNITSNPRDKADFRLTATKVYVTKSCYSA